MTGEVLEACKADGTRLIPFCTIDPYAEDIEKKIAMFVERGCLGFGEHRVGLPVDHTSNYGFESFRI